MPRCGVGLNELLGGTYDADLALLSEYIEMKPLSQYARKLIINSITLLESLVT